MHYLCLVNKQLENNLSYIQKISEICAMNRVCRFKLKDCCDLCFNVVGVGMSLNLF